MQAKARNRGANLNRGAGPSRVHAGRSCEKTRFREARRAAHGRADSPDISAWPDRPSRRTGRTGSVSGAFGRSVDVRSGTMLRRVSGLSVHLLRSFATLAVLPPDPVATAPRLTARAMRYCVSPGVAARTVIVRWCVGVGFGALPLTHVARVGRAPWTRQRPARHGRAPRRELRSVPTAQLRQALDLGLALDLDPALRLVWLLDLNWVSP